MNIAAIFIVAAAAALGRAKQTAPLEEKFT
jgi:hypothetical protein